MRISDWSSDVCSSDLGDEPAAHLAGAGQLTVIGVELLVQHEEAAHLAARELRVAGEVAVHPRDLALDDLDDPGIGSEFLIAAIGHVRSEERRVGKECVSTCRSRWSPDH